MKNKTLSTAILLLLCLQCFAQKDTCKIGLYVNCVYDFKLDEKSYVADFWMWMNFKNDTLDFHTNVDITNSKSTDFSHYSREKKGGINWATQKCKAQIMQQWDISNYPFDRQNLKIEIEDAEHDASRMIYVADTLNSRLDPAFVSSEWTLKSFTIKGQVRKYPTSYGNPLLSEGSTYPQVVAEITIKRNHSWLLLMKLLTGAYVAFLIASLVFFVSSENQDSRFGLCVGGLFTAIGNKYISESILPASNTYTLMDNVHNVTLGFILLIVIVSIITLNFYESGDNRKKHLSFTIDRISFWSILFSYIAINAFMIYKALYHG